MRQATGTRIGIHTHDDAACAVANALAAIDAGATHVQGTANGYGERSGNANLFSVVANLQLKLGREVLPTAGLAEMTRIAHAVSEVTNVAPNPQAALRRHLGVRAQGRAARLGDQGRPRTSTSTSTRSWSATTCGCWSRRWPAGPRSSSRAASWASTCRPIPTRSSRVTNRVKELEACGYSFEAADASFELLLRGELSGAPVRFFEVLSWRTFADRLADGAVVNQATVKLRVKDEEVLAAGEGNGPVNALDNALRAALAAAYPALAGLELMDYKVRILDRRPRHRLADQGADHHLGRRGGVVHGRRGRERHHRVVAGTGRRGDLRSSGKG